MLTRRTLTRRSAVLREVYKPCRLQSNAMQVDGCRLRCLVRGSFQLLLEARGAAR